MSDDASKHTVTQADVAAHAGVSRAMVSYVLNNGPRKVSDETRRRVLAAIRELGYRPNKYAQRLRLGADAAHNSIGIIAGGETYNLLERPYYSVVLASLFDAAHHMNQHIRFFSFFDDLKDPIFFNKNIHREEISSLLILLPQLIARDAAGKEIMDKLKERIDTIICLERSIEDLPALIVDMAHAAQIALEHLIQLGHTRIGFLALPDERIDGYKRTLGQHQIMYDEQLVRVMGSSNMRNAYDFTVDLIKSVPDMTAIFASNDESAIAAIAAIQDHGLSAPDDIAIVSIDNITIASMVRPALTTVHVPIREIGEYASRMLISQLESPLSHPASMVLPIELIIRESCGAKKRSP